ncbi:hypothetical protein MTO96_006348 [Rhipicephalus appendiculatus]
MRIPGRRIRSRCALCTAENLRPSDYALVIRRIDPGNARLRRALELNGKEDPQNGRSCVAKEEEKTGMHENSLRYCAVLVVGGGKECPPTRRMWRPV